MSTVEYWDGTGVTPAGLEAEVRRLAAEQPEHVYDAYSFSGVSIGAKCKYTHTLDNGEKVPGCIVGVAIHNITGKLVDQERWGGGVLDFGFMGGEHTLDYNGYLRWSPLARFLGNVQHQQDSGVAWGEAVRRADDPQDSNNWFQDFDA